MAAATLSGTSVPMTNAGLNITDATFVTLVAGSGNGVKYAYVPGDILVLKNDTGGAAVFSFVTPVPSSLSALSITLTTPTLMIADGKTYFVRPDQIFKNSDGNVVVECDVAGKAMLLSIG